MRQKGRPRTADIPHRELAKLAGRQHGVVSGRQLASLGFSPSAITRAVAAGRLHRLHRGVYAVGHASVSRHGRHLAAVLACGPGSLLSHGSAAWLLGLSGRHVVPIEVTAPARRRPRRSIALHHARALLAEDRTEVAGIPVTALPRTLLDLAARLPAERLERAIERAERLGIFDLRPVESTLARAGGHPGAGRLRHALALYRDEAAFTRSPLERRFLDLVRKAGLPRPSTNHFVEGYELDAYWPRERFAVELDGFEFHRTRMAFERDRLRQEELKLAGIEMIRVTHRRLSREPDRLVEHIATLLERRRQG